MVVPEPFVAYDHTQFSEWLASLTPLGAESNSGSARQPRVHNLNRMTAASAARAYERMLGVRDMDGRSRDGVQTAQFVDGPLSGPGMPEIPGLTTGNPRLSDKPPVLPDIPPVTQPTAPAPVQTQPVPQQTQVAPVQAQPAPAAGPTNSSPPSGPPTQELEPTTVQNAPTTSISATPVSQPSSLNGLMLGVQQPTAAQTMYQGLPDVVDFAQNAPVMPGDSTSFAGVATVTIGGDHTRITDTHNPVTGDRQTMVRDKFGALVSVKTSEIVPGTGGLTRDATIVDRRGTSQVRTVDDGYGNRITWTANPDGSHSVHYSSANIIVVEPAPGSSLPAQIIQLSPDGKSGQVVMSHNNGETSTADFGPGVFGAPVTKYTRSDGTSIEVLTVPGRTNSQPISIVTDAMGNRAVVQPDGTTTPVDRYNTVIGGPSYGNKFDPSNATWVSDPITSRGPMVRVPDGTSVQKWYGRKPDGSKYELDAYFDEQGNLRGIGDGDSTGIKYTSFSSIDGIFVPADTINLDAGNAIDNRQLVYDAVMIAFGIPELAFLGTRLGVGLGSRYFGSRLVGQGASLTGRELAIAGLGAGDALTGLSGGARAAKNPSTPQVQAPPPSLSPARPQLTQLSANAPKLRPNSLAQSPISVASSVPLDAYLRSGMGVPLSQALKSEAQIGQAVREVNVRFDQLLMLEARAKTLVTAGFRNTSSGSPLGSSLNFGRSTKTASASNAPSTSGAVPRSYTAPVGGRSSQSVGSGGSSRTGRGGQRKSPPPWVLKQMEEGNEFNRRREPYYTSLGGANEIHVGARTPKGKFLRLDSYIHGSEIVSRKHTQLSDISQKSAVKYLRELVKKYGPGTRIANTPSNRSQLPAYLIGRGLSGRMILEVPVQLAPVPPMVKAVASRLRITIRDENGNIL
ncbi:hypothetical protein [Nocardia fluminea]|uniref:hypothetical protein n=1 Tax=Nocardia fluminea TaxID=134984 RepID=UPI00342BE809